VLAKSGDIAAKQLKKRLRAQRAATGFRTSDVKEWAFDSTAPSAVDWVKEHAAETIKGISEDTRAQIRDLIEESFSDQFDVEDLAGEIADIIGDDARAEVIARTEVMRASNAGQIEAWDQATEAGLLTGNESKEWIVTPDDRLCPICEPMDGVQVGLDEMFDVDGDQVDEPPAHPNCRCTIGLVLET
jgi:SPP1 gp7 family putative phage head morphogenesis protein